MRRSRPALLTALVLVLGLFAATTGPAGADPIPPRQDTRIVGGSQSSTGQFPWAVFLTRRSSGRPQGFACGGTVLSKSWVLTAGHCVLDYDDEYPDSRYGNYVAPSYFDVVTGTNSLSSGGQRLPVVAIYPHPNFDPYDLDNDYTLLRIGRPTTAPEIKVIGSTSAELALDDAGKPATTIGWGTTSSGAQTVPDLQRYVNININSDATCQAAYPIGRTDEDGYPLEYHPANMLCAGPLSGGKDSCQGDSGGPLAVQAPDLSWRQVGVVSFGYGCAFPGNPGIYSRLTAASKWISNTRRFGPFNPDATAYIDRMYRDYTGKGPTAAQLADWRSKLASNAASDLPVAFQTGAAWDASAGAVTRLYSAAFERLPDSNGLSHWVNRRFAGVGIIDIATNYASSSEFIGKYGSLGNDDFITQVYANIFHRAADPGGRSYWLARLDAGRPRGQMLYELSNSNEYRTETAATVRVVTARFALIRAVPSPAVIDLERNIAVRQLLDNLRSSYSYANRITS